MSDIKKLLSKSEEAGKPTEGERGLLINSLSLLSKNLESELRDCDSIIVDIAIQELESLQAENAELRKRSEWISVDDELPPIMKTVDVWLDGEEYYERAWLNAWSDGSVCWIFSNDRYSDCYKQITHWKKLNDKPKGE